MKIKLKIILISSLFIIYSCSKENNILNILESNPIKTKNEFKLNKNEIGDLDLKILNEDKNENIIIKSDNTEIVGIISEKLGLIYAKKTGKTEINIFYKNFIKKLDVEVYNTDISTFIEKKDGKGSLKAIITLKKDDTSISKMKQVDAVRIVIKAEDGTKQERIVYPSSTQVTATFDNVPVGKVKVYAEALGIGGYQPENASNVITSSEVFVPVSENKLSDSFIELLVPKDKN